MYYQLDVQDIRVKGKFTSGGLLYNCLCLMLKTRVGLAVRELRFQSDDSRVNTVVEEMPWYSKAR